MKVSRLFPTVPGLVLLAIPVVGFAQQETAPPLVTAVGTAEIKVTPDLADLSFEVEVRRRDLATARKEQAERAAAVLVALRAAGVGDKDLGTTQARISTNYTSRQEETDQVQYYAVTQTVNCTLHDVKKVSDLTAAVVAAGATGVNPVVLQSSEARRYKDEARREAAVAAREKATLLATELGAKIGRPNSITEYDTAPYSPGRNIFRNFSGNGDGRDVEDGATYAAGLLSISAAVQVSFVLE